jgi:hypothetical protein
MTPPQPPSFSTESVARRPAIAISETWMKIAAARGRLGQATMITKYELYSDERMEAQGGSRYLSIGGVICTYRGRERLLAELQQVRRSHALNQEMRWERCRLPRVPRIRCRSTASAGTPSRLLFSNSSHAFHHPCAFAALSSTRSSCRSSRPSAVTRATRSRAHSASSG